ncbi:MAG: aminotransferase class V-fold PLP-dependent enzyme [Candidatus Eremiobacteraeota bacterium]|nr:aminotransferase class V-fold PLP-dependent enzyme [Candidatus Eremiobacteraeota bacterium]
MVVQTDPLLARRAEFPILSTCTYLISNSLGAMPAAARARLNQYADDWMIRGVEAWNDWLVFVNQAGDLIAPLIGAEPGTVIMQPNVTIAESILISCLNFSGKRNKVVYSNLEFPTIHYAWQAQAERGATFHVVESSDGVTVDTQALCDAIDESTLVVPISHVIFRSGYVQDVAPIIEKAHRVGALVFLDVYQSIGVVPIDVQSLRPDAVVGGALKWLCGGPGACFLYVRPDLYERLVPSNVGWFSHARPFDFEIGPMQFAPGVWRYAGGTPNPAALYAAFSGLEVINEIGVAAIRQRSMEHTAFAVEQARANRLTLNSPEDPAARGGHITVDFPNAQSACRELIARGFMVDYRPKAGIRIAPHFYNSRDEIGALFSEIRTILGRG